MRRLDCTCCKIGFALVTAWAATASAVTDIRFERWFVDTGVRQDVVPPVDSVSAVSVSFDATATAGDQDPAHGLRFAIAERDPDGNDVLARFELQPCAPLATVGSDVTIEVSMAVYCDAAGELRVRDGMFWVSSWCDLPQQQECRSDGRQPAASLPSTSEPEAWEFVVLGDGDVEGSFPTPEDVAVCGAPPADIEYVAPEFAESGSIGVFADAGGVVCSDHVTLFEPFRWYVVADLAGMTQCGVTVVELGITPPPPGFFINVIPHPDAFVFGTPFGQGVLGFQCERGDGERIVLYTLEGVATQPVQDVAMVVGAGMPPSNMFWPYPWVDLCPHPGSPRRRMRTSTFYINPSPAHDCDAPVPATPASWTRVKSLFRN